MSLAALLTVMAVHFAAAVSPGPAFVVALRVAARDGKSAAMALALGLGLGAATWAAAALLGLTALFQFMPDLLVALRLGGAAFLLFIAFMMWRCADLPLPLPTQPGAPSAFWKVARLGFLTQISNPKAAVFFGAVFIGLVPADLTSVGFALLLAAIFAVETGWYCIVALLFSRSAARTAYGRAKGITDRVLGGLLAGLGVKIALG